MWKCENVKMNRGFADLSGFRDLPVEFHYKTLIVSCVKKANIINQF